MLEKSIKNLMEIVSLSEDEIKKNDRNVSAILDLEDLKSLKELLDYFKENKLDLTTVYLKGVYDGKEQATADLTITKEKLAEDTFKENIKLKKELEKLKKMKAQKLNYMQIKLNGKIEDISAMIVGAERYALGRRTYIVQWTCEFIGNNLHLLTEKDKQVMIRDIENPISYGDECDKVCWMQLLEMKKQNQEKENKDEAQQMLSWFQILMLIGRPLWDKKRKKWRVLNGYQAVLGNTNNLFYEVTFTDTPYWENYADEQLYLNVPAEKEKQKESGDKGSNNKDK